MTVKEIINKIKHILEELTYPSAVAYLTFNDKKWLKATIKALEQEPCDDAVSRQEAIEAFQIFQEYESNRSNKEWVDRIETVLNQLSSVNPQPKYEDIAKAFQFGLAFGFGEKHDEMDRVIDEIKKVITPQPKTGHWKHNKCDKCGVSRPPLFDNYCPNCGARMFEPQESERV